MLRRRSLSDINSFKGRNYGKGPPPADLLSCFPPSRPRLTLMPKPAGSPARAAEPPSRHRRRKSGPITLWAKSNKSCNSDLSEPTSPKVTCVGQIKVRPRPTSCKNWQSVMDEIERMHNKKKHNKIKKRSSSPWMEALGFKRDVTRFLRCLRNIQFDFRCFGSFPSADQMSSEEEDDHSEENDDGDEDDKLKEDFSKVFMISPCLVDKNDGDDDGGESNIAPPMNALMLTRCRSASWVEEREEERERKQKLVVMRCGEEFSKLSLDIAVETWVGGGIQDFLARSTSCKR